VFPVGYAYLDHQATATAAHLWVVCAEPLPDPEERVIVSVTSDAPHVSDRSCPLEAGEHDFIKHRSFVLFRKARIVTEADLAVWLSRGYLTPKAAVASALIERIREAAISSPYTPRAVQAAIRNCGWVPPTSAQSGTKP
jgi:hypothetical protein